MDPRPLATIVSLLGIASFASCVLQLAASWVAGHSPGPGGSPARGTGPRRPA